MVGSTVTLDKPPLKHYSGGTGAPRRLVLRSVCNPNLGQHSILEAPASSAANPKETKQIRKAPTFLLLICI